MASTESHVSGNRGDQRSSEEIRRSIERQRDDLDVTTEVLQRKLAPRELAEQLWNDMRTKVSTGAGDVAGVVKRHPVPLGLIGAGIAWWIYETSSGRGVSFGHGDYDEDELGVGSMSTGSYATRSSYAGDYSSGEGAYADSAGETWRERSLHAAQRSGERLRSGAQHARQGFSDAVERNPLALGAACFSLGLLAAIAVPSSRWENATLGESSDRVTRKARNAAKRAAVGAAEQGARAAQDAAERIRDEAVRSPSQYAADRQRAGESGESWRRDSGAGAGTYRGSTGSGTSSGSSSPGSTSGSWSGSSSTPSSSTGSSGTGSTSYGTASSSGTKPTSSSTKSTSSTTKTGRTGSEDTDAGRDPWDPDRPGRS